MFEPKSIVFTEKYRPSSVKDVVGDFKEKIIKYLQDPNAIPHFLFYSKTPGTGKCVTDDTIFLTPNGLMSIKEFVNKNNINNEKTDVVTELFCPETGINKTEYFYKGKSSTIKIITAKGYSLEGTPEHKIRVFDLQHGIVWKELQHIQEDDIIPIFFNTLKFANNNKFDYAGFVELKKANDNSSIMISKPIEMNKQIAYLLGVFTANGLFDNESVHISTFKDWLQKRILCILQEEFGIEGKIRNYKGYNEGVDTSSVWLGRFFKNICGVKEATARNKSVPKKIFEGSSDIQMNYIYGLLEDSWISKEGYIEYSTASEQLANEIKYLLLNLGYIVKHSTKYLEEYKHTYHALTLSVEHSQKFLEHFDMVYKNEVIKYKDNMNTNMLSYSTLLEKFVANKRKEFCVQKCDIYEKNLVKRKYLKGSFQRVNKVLPDLMKEDYLKETIGLFLDNKIFLDTVINIKRSVEEKNIYDFHIPKTHSFLANGIINHNTTLAKAIINDLGCDKLIINSSDDRKIETVREKVKQFSITKSSKENLKRCVFLDEVDGMLKASQDALRNVMETYSSNVFFILTCNNINKIIEPLRSRCITLAFAYPKKEEIYIYLTGICEKEQIQYSEEGIQSLIELNYPSIRNCVLAIQDIKTEGLNITTDTVRPVDEVMERMWDALDKKDWKAIKTEVMQTTVDPRELNTYFWRRALDEERIRLIQLTCRNERDIALGADPKVIVITSLIELVK